MKVGRWARAIPDGVEFLRVLARLRRSQWMPPEQMKVIQDAQLRRLIAHAHAHTPFYRRRFAEAGIRPQDVDSLAAIERLPIITRDDVLAHHADMAADNARRYRPERGHTSGTTGTRLEFLRDQRTVRMANAAMWRFEGWHGVRWRHRRAEIRSSEGMEHPTHVIYSHGSRTLVVNVTSPHLTPQVAADALAEFKPEVIVARTPAWFTYLSLHVLERRPHSIRPRMIFTRGERLLPEQRQVMSEAFGAPVVDVYATHEFLVFGGECERGRMHAATEMGIVEVLKGGRPAPSGEEGTLVLTSLWNYAFPFIRYDIGDLAVLESAGCPCGRTLPVWRIVGGKRRDLIATRRGYMYVPTYLLAAPRWRGKIAAHQFRQDTRGAIVARVVRDSHFTDADTDTLRADLAAYFKGEVDVEVEFLDHIDLTASGKLRFVVSTVPVEV